MIAYASNTGTLRNLQALRDNGWRVLLTPANPSPPPSLRFAIDNGAWTAYQQKKPFDAAGFEQLVERFGCAADFVILPDIVACGKDSLAFSVSWLPKLPGLKHLLLPIQDGMTADEVGMVLRLAPRVGLFLGGSTEYKLREMYAWGMVAHAWRRHFHVGRVNTRRRIRLCAMAGADSFDGTSASMYSCTVPLLNAALQQPSLLTPAALL